MEEKTKIIMILILSMFLISPLISGKIATVIINSDVVNDTYSYNTTEAGDQRFVNIDGDNMTGDLNMSSNNITNVGSLLGNFLGSIVQRITKLWVTEIDLGGKNVSDWTYNQTLSSSDNWNIIEGLSLDFNETKLESIYYNVTQYVVVKGTIDGGTIKDICHLDGNYDGITMNFSESSGSPGVDIRFNFTNVNTFNQGVMRFKTSDLKGDYPIVQMWNYDSSSWDDYPPVGESESFATMTQPVFNAENHLSDGVAQMRIYKASTGNTQNHYFVDWIAIIEGVGVPSGQEIDPFSHHRDENITLDDGIVIDDDESNSYIKFKGGRMIVVIKR